MGAIELVPVVAVNSTLRTGWSARKQLAKYAKDAKKGLVSKPRADSTPLGEVGLVSLLLLIVLGALGGSHKN